jgi:hypothetical protein
VCKRKFQLKITDFEIFRKQSGACEQSWKYHVYWYFYVTRNIAFANLYILNFCHLFDQKREKKAREQFKTREMYARYDIYSLWNNPQHNRMFQPAPVEVQWIEWAHRIVSQ